MGTDRPSIDHAVGEVIFTDLPIPLQTSRVSGGQRVAAKGKGREHPLFQLHITNDAMNLDQCVPICAFYPQRLLYW